MPAVLAAARTAGKAVAIPATSTADAKTAQPATLTSDSEATAAVASSAEGREEWAARPGPATIPLCHDRSRGPLYGIVVCTSPAAGRVNTVLLCRTNSSRCHLRPDSCGFLQAGI